MISAIQGGLNRLKNVISQNAFDNIRGQMGIKSLQDLEDLKNLPKKGIPYNKFDAF